MLQPGLLALLPALFPARPSLGGTAVCTPGTFFYDGCNTCFCNSRSIPTICTEVHCERAPPTAPPSRCRAASGPAAGKECVFPFRYAGWTYSSCAEWTWQGRDQGRLWCSTRTGRSKHR